MIDAPDPAQTSPEDELSPTLREAVDQIRRAPLPAGVCERLLKAAIDWERPGATGYGKLHTCKERAMNGTRQSSSFNWRSVVAAAVLMAAFLIWAIWRFPQMPEDDPGGPIIANPIAAWVQTGEVRRENLEDGTVVLARGGAKFIADGPRHMRLEKGEIYLIVAKADRPFVVETGDGKLTAKGTRFYV